jgi:membrane protein
LISRFRSILLAVGKALPSPLFAVISQTVGLLGDTYAAWRRSRTIRLGAGLAYYALFAIVPLLAITLALAEFMFSQEDLQAQLAERLENLLGGQVDEISALLTEQLGNASTQSGLGVIGGISLLVAGVGLFVALQDALNTIWGAPVASGIASMIRRYALGLAIVVLTVAVLVGSLAVQAIAGLLETLAADDSTVLDPLVSVAEVIGSWAIVGAAVVVVFRELSPQEVTWRDAMIGGLITAAALLVGTWLIGYYLSHYGGASLAGAAGGVALVLVWIYYEAQILLGGAVLTRVLDDRRRRRPVSSA